MRESVRVGSIVSFSLQPPLLRLSGDESCSSQALRRPALSRAQKLAEDLIVDLTELEFADASLMVDLAMVARRLRKAGAQMVVRGAQPQISKLIEIAGLHRLPSVSVVGLPATS